jgi:two-component system NtrC family response regulator
VSPSAPQEPSARARAGAGERILFVEDDAASRELGLFNLRRAGYEVDDAASGDAALALFEGGRGYDLVVTDVRIPGLSGTDLLQRIKAQAPDIPVIVVTAYGNVELAVTAMRDGAADFIGKPFNREHLLLAVARALEGRRLRSELRALRIRAAGVERPIVAHSAAMRRLLDLTDRVAGSDATVLVTGESGSGKELVARRIHVRSARAEGPFVVLNCAAIPGELLESELFGHEKGAFTGAHRARPGRFRQADGGTLFLDEVAELPPALQSKLLRVLQERVVDVVGRDTPVPVNVRVVAATNRELPQLVREGRFREDLLYRLNVVELRVPALRERPEDIPPLVRHFVARFAGDRDVSVPEPLLAELLRRPWPGNVRELENACERLVILCAGDTLDVRDLPPRPGAPAGAPAALPTAFGAGAEALTLDDWPPLPPGGLSLVDLEKRVIERVLALRDGNVSAAARYLRVPRHILTYRLQKHGIARDGAAAEEAP